MVYDMFNNKIFLNDEVKFMIGRDQHTGTVNFISPSGLLRINALVGEYRRKPNNVIKVIRGTDTGEHEGPMNEVNEVEQMHFIDEEHKLFYEQNILKCHASNDVYRRALFYCLGIDSNTRSHIKDLYDFNENFINPEGINCAWQTDGSRAVTRLAFNLYSDSTPTIANFDELDEEKRLAECRSYSVHNIFSGCSTNYFKCFIEAIRIRYSYRGLSAESSAT